MKLLKSVSGKFIEAGCDEVGRGCLCGPVVAAAVILDDKFNQNLVNDSKKLTFKRRQSLDQYIKENVKDFAISELSPSIIDENNILNASFQAMHLSLDQLKIRPELLLVDGNRFHPYGSIPHQCIVKGDAKFSSIAAASVLAKTYRDEYMRKLAAEYPEYGWERNMGYTTKEHIEAIIAHGYTPHHRKSFHLKQLEPTLF